MLVDVHVATYLFPLTSYLTIKLWIPWSVFYKLRYCDDSIRVSVLKDKFNFHSISDTVFLHGPTEQIRDVTNILGFEFRHSGFDEGTGLVERDAILVFSDVSKALFFWNVEKH
jgi:hypothetical protein